MVVLAEARDDLNGSALVVRWVVILTLAAAIHCVPMLCLTLSAAPLASDVEFLSVDFADVPAEPDEGTAPKDPAQAGPAIALKPPTLPETTPHTPAAAPTVPPAPAPPAAAVKPAVPNAVAAAPKTKLNVPELEPLVAPGVAFDESKTTKEVPKEGYLSDRNSTAADKGPKSLPRGDPFMDKGESKAIRYQQRRGEGSLPALPSSDTSGSVKKEGNPDAGRGIPDLRPPDARQPLRPPAPETKDIAKTVPDVVTADTKRPPDPSRDRPKAVGKETPAGDAADGIGPGPARTPPAPKTEPVGRVANSTHEAATPSLVPSDKRETAPAPATDTAREQPVDELAAFKALLDGRGATDGRGGDAGNKAGVHARPGAKGHEGDGNLRPGHDEAVSDVTTINLESSAEEFDEARFAKKFDARTAYIKPLARRIDNKWKAERVARNRVRLAPGVVTFKIVMREDGKLLEAAEVSRTPKDLPDEYAASAKVAIERAASPLSEPFPPALADKETLEFSFNFLY